MRKSLPRIATLALAALLAAHGLVRAADAKDLTPDVDRVTKSLVMVEFTLRNENASREETGQGIVLSKDGVVLIAGSLIPEALPKDWVKDLKIRVPGKQFTSVPATFLGRTTNRLFAFVKADEAISATPLDLSKTAASHFGQQVYSVAMLDKSGGYEPYIGTGPVKAIVHLTHNLAITGSFALTRANSPVFDSATNALVGVTFPALPQTMVLSIGGKEGAVPVQLRDDEQVSAFLPWDEIKDLVATVPEKPFESPRPWMGVDGLTGVEENMRTLYGIEQSAAVTVGNVIPGAAADKAGLKSRDIILTVNGEPFSTATVPDFMTQHFQRRMEKFKVGDEVTLGILRDGKTKMDIKLTLASSPKLGSEMAHVHDARLGITTRDLVFSDTYSRKLPAETKGVMVALVKQGAPAAIGQTPLEPGYLITKVNDQNVENQQQFAATMKKIASDGEQKEIVFRVIRQDGETQVCRIDMSK